MTNQTTTHRKPRGLSRLARDTRGNTLALMAVAMLPMCAMGGSAIDTARMYVVKVRLQQACDAGVLAGRKFMTSSNDVNLDAEATKQARAFFDSNFRKGWMQTADVQFTPRKTADQQVAGDAQAVVPMTIMKMFAMNPVTLKVVCEARFDVADTDIVFVLDTTGSMACLPSDSEQTCSAYVQSKVDADAIDNFDRPSNSSPDQVAGYAGQKGYGVPEKSGSRIAALRQAVKNFYKTVDDNVDPTTHIRYGFVSYASSVNAGGSIMAKSPSYMLGGSGSGTTESTFTTRKVDNDYTVSTTDAVVTATESQCKAYPASTRTPNASNATSTMPFAYDSGTGTATVVSYAWANSKCTKTTKTVGPQWIYKELPLNVADFVAGREVQDPTKNKTAKVKWLGCIEERATRAGAMSFDQSDLPADLDPNLVPSNIDTRWRPMWAAVTYARNRDAFTYRGQLYRYYNGTDDDYTNGDDNEQAPWYGTVDRQESGNVACGKPIRRLATMTAADVAGYVDATDFRAIGGTYHDAGMIWGARLLSPNGIFKNDTTAWPGRQSPRRVIVFLTDGDMSPNQLSLGLYGVEYYRKRVTDGDFDRIKAYHNARFLAACEAAKALNVDVWTVAIGLETTAELESCATTKAQALWTESGDGLSTHFERIAKQVAMLRVSK